MSTPPQAISTSRLPRAHCSLILLPSSQIPRTFLRPLKFIVAPITLDFDKMSTTSAVASATSAAVSATASAAASKASSTYKVVGICLAIGSGLFIGSSFVIKKKVSGSGVGLARNLGIVSGLKGGGEAAEAWERAPSLAVMYSVGLR